MTTNKKTPRLSWTWFWLVLLIFIIFFGGLYRMKAQSPAEVLKMSQDIGIQFPEIVTAQAILETGWFGCASCSMDHSNLFGFRWKGHYLEFAHWRRSVYYYKHWQKKHYKGGDYYDFLIDRGYATDPSYITKLKAIDV